MSKQTYEEIEQLIIDMDELTKDEIKERLQCIY